MIEILNALITLLCLAIMARGVKKGQYDSSLASWIIWSCIFSFLFIISFVDGGWTVMSALMAAQALGHIAMIFITYKYSTKEILPEEKNLIVVSVVGFAVWGSSLLASKLCDINPSIVAIIGITGQIVADAMGAIPFMKFIKRDPDRQPIWGWILNFFIYPLTIYGTYIRHESWTAYIFIVYGWCLYGTMLAMLLYGRWRQKRKLLGAWYNHISQTVGATLPFFLHENVFTYYKCYGILLNSSLRSNYSIT